MYTPFAYAFVYGYDYLRTGLSDMTTDPSTMPASDDTHGILTREKARQVDLAPLPDIEIGKGFKLQDPTLLNDCISKAAIRSSCSKASSRLALYQKNNERQGLSESLFLKCSCCEAETPLSTSRRLAGKDGGAHEVNRRAALASC